MVKILENQSGITLTALVITVIVMAILVGATIFNISAKDGIINQTRYVVDEADEKAIIDDVQIAVTKLAAQWDGNGTIQAYIIAKLREKGEDGYLTENDAKISCNENGILTYKDSNNKIVEIEKGAKKLKIDEDGKVIKISVES